MSGTKTVSTGYVPRQLQSELHKKLKRFSVLVCHRRFGKTVFAINEMIDRGLRVQLKNPRCAYLAPLYGQAKRVAWDYLKMYTANIPGVVTNEADLRVDIARPHLNDTVRFTLLGADNPASLKGIYLDLAVLDEYGDMNPMTWREVIRPTLSDRGGRAIFIGTPKGRNSFYDLYKRASLGTDLEWFAAIYKASETGIISDKELESAKSEMTPEEYEQEFECSFNAGLVGAYFAKELDKAEKESRISQVPHDPMMLVDTYWDLGINDTTAVWFVQSVFGKHRMIRYYEANGLSLPEHMSNIQKFGYNLGVISLPHDAQVRDYGTGKTRVETLYSLGFRKVRVIPRVGNKADSINAARMAFSKCFFDKTNCERGLEVLANYQRKWDPKNNVFLDAPLHNWASNGADAFQQFGLGLKEETGSSDRRFSESREIEVVTEYNPFER